MIYSRRYFFKVTGGALIAVLAGLIVTPALADQTNKPKFQEHDKKHRASTENEAKRTNEIVEIVAAHSIASYFYVLP